MKTIAFLALLFACAAVLARGGVSGAAAGFSISGVLWEDENADGVRQGSEPGLRDVIFQVGKIISGELVFTGPDFRPLILDESGHFPRADASGHYSIGGLEPGSYVLRLLSPGIYYMTSPARRGGGRYFDISVTITAESVSGVDIGLHAPPRGSVMAIRGLAWVNAAPAEFTPPAVGRGIRAFIDGVDCTGPGGILPTDQLPNTFLVGVMPAGLVSGCGQDGKTIRFTVEGHLANETAIWQSTPAGPTELDLTVGPAFAYFVTAFRRGSELPAVHPGLLKVLVDGQDCGRIFGAVYTAFFVVVPSRELAPGCGYAGAAMKLEIDRVEIDPPIEWQPGRLNISLLELPTGPSGASLRAPDTGDGGLTAASAQR